ncbi:MAG TPA: RelA/SpoT family protein [Exilispira sp.]|nr:RelA/SpoT family protein [Exilispira sp.]
MISNIQKLEQEFFQKINLFEERDKELILKAYKISYEKHLGQKRLSGEDYITHPLSVALILLDLKMDVSTISAALMHDILEDTETTEEEILKIFNPTILKLIKGVTKISAMRNSAQFVSRGYEDLRRFIFSIIDDLRVLIIKLADRLHNMRTLQYQPPAKQIEIAKNTLELYAPLAARLGMEWIKDELEDLALYYIDHKSYQYIKEAIASKKEDRKKYIESIIDEIKAIIEKEKLNNINIEGRGKHFYSIYRKLKFQNKNIDEIYDLMGIRILAESIRDCYTVLGIIHNLYKPIPSRFKDYIAFPKANLYQSLHTTVIDNNGKHIEVQIRTYEMDNNAKYGVAAHWMYKENISDEKKIETELKIFSKLKDWKQQDFSDENLMENLKAEILSEQIFVYTPRGDVVQLPKNATTLDFAFAIHTDIGLHCIGARVNGKFVPIRKELKGGEVVEILTSKKQLPSIDWLEITKTRKAKSKIRSFFREVDKLNRNEKIKLSSDAAINVINSINTEKKLDLSRSINSEKKSERPNELKSEVENKNKVENLYENKYIYVFGNHNILYQFATCCNPRPADKIVGYISISKHSVVIHKAQCKFIQRIINEYGNSRIVPVSWNDPFATFNRKYKIESEENSTKIISEIVNAIDIGNLHLKELNSTVKDLKTVCFITVESKTEESFQIFENQISQLEDRLKLLRIN